jgi:hypothetical protein
MKNGILIALACIVLIACQVNSNADVGSESMLLSPEYSRLEKPMEFCCNNLFPPFEHIGGTSYTQCEGGEPVLNFSKESCASLWNNWISMGDNLAFLACGVNPNGTNINPYFWWGARYNHFYTIQRDVNGNGWTVIDTLKNCYSGLGDDNCGEVTAHQYTDDTIDLSTFSGVVEYRVRAHIFNSYSSNNGGGNKSD